MTGELLKVGGSIKSSFQEGWINCQDVEPNELEEFVAWLESSGCWGIVRDTTLQSLIRVRWHSLHQWHGIGSWDIHNLIEDCV